MNDGAGFNREPETMGERCDTKRGGALRSGAMRGRAAGLGLIDIAQHLLSLGFIS